MERRVFIKNLESIFVCESSVKVTAPEASSAQLSSAQLCSARLGSARENRKFCDYSTSLCQHRASWAINYTDFRKVNVILVTPGSQILKLMPHWLKAEIVR